jgi:hypothetical protein
LACFVRVPRSTPPRQKSKSSSQVADSIKLTQICTQPARLHPLSPPKPNDSPPLNVRALADPAVAISPAVIARVNRILFPDYAPPSPQFDACLILGSRNCGYRVRAALRQCPVQPSHYLVSGGGLMTDGTTEAAYMNALLRAQGIAADRIVIEDSSHCTADNLHHVSALLPALMADKAVFSLLLVTAGFHMRRTLAMAQPIFASLPALQLFPLAAYGPHTSPDNWPHHAIGRQVIADELVKLDQMQSLPAGIRLTGP